MAQVEINPSDMKTTVALDGGKYGANQEFPAEVKINVFEYPSKRNPGYDKDGTEGPYAFFIVSILTATGDQGFARIFVNDLSRLKSMLAAANVPFSDDGNGGIGFDTDDVAPREIGGIEVKAKREYTNAEGQPAAVTGDILRLFAA